MEKITLYNVTDTRTGKFHSEAVIKPEHEKWFVSEDEEDEGGDDNGDG